MVFLNDTVSGSDATLTVADVQKKILTVDNVDPDNIEFVPKEKGFSTLMNRFDEKLKIIDTLGDTANILPDAFKVGFKDPTRYETTVQQLKNLPEVYTVRDNREYAEKLMGINQTVTVVGTWIVGLLLVVSLFMEHPKQTGRTSYNVAIRRANLHIAHHLGEVVDFPALAKQCGMGYSLFRKRFREYNGMSPLEYQIALRIRRAMNLLGSSELPVAQIAAEAGFESHAYFSRFFRKETGMSPIEYRRSQSTSD